jgi:FAD/FMN-containing dehydrogenase/Fe-S oxidoreductase
MPLPPEFLYELHKQFTGDIRTDIASRILYSTDASMYQIEPLGVVIPRTQEELHAAVESAAKYKMPILPRGSGSSLGGQAIGEALILDCSRYLTSILEINPEEHYAIVEPGVILSDLNRAVAKHGLMFGPDPASAERATMGGVIGNNATGAHSILYGMSADHLLEAEVVLSDGSLEKWGEVHEKLSVISKQLSVSGRQLEIISAVNDIREKYSEAIKQNYPKSWRNSAGYRLNYLLPFSPSKPPQWQGDYPNLKHFDRLSTSPETWNLAPLLAGSEGTLAVIRRMKVNLVKKPKHTILGVLQYQSIEQACDDVPRLLEMIPSAVELIPKMILELARSVPAAASQMGWMVGNPEAVLVVEFSGEQLSALKACVERCRNEAVRGLDEVSTNGKLLTIAESNEEQNRIWNIRKLGLGILDSRPQSARPIAFIEDCAIPVEKLGEFVREVQKILTAHNTYAGIYAHASGGCLHIRPVLDLMRGEGVKSMRSIVEQVFALTMNLGGSMSSEHGDGIVSGEFIERTYGKEITDAMRKLKHVADPDNILNPKKMFDAPPMDSNLRYGENYQVQVWDSALHFEHERGLAGAIEQCNGQGLCRKSSGVMCPSFQASGEEGLSTRGRANLLRVMIGRGGVKRELENSVFETLDLCLACKGCTSECPSGVDMPRLKYEFMNHYYKSHRRPLHDYLFAYFHVAAKWMSPIAPLANRLMTMKWSKAIIANIFGLAKGRSLPLFRRSRLQRGEEHLPQSTQSAQSFLREGREKKVVLFLSDVFSEYLEPEVKEAAIEVLNHFGYEVKVLSVIGAGASFLSKGFIEQARTHASQVLDEIKSLGAESGIPVVGCEPPEVYCLKHEYAALLPNRKAEIESISKNVFLVDEFILRVARLEQPPNDLDLNNNAGFDTSRDASTSLSLRSARAGLLNQRVFFHPHCHQRAEGEWATVELLKLFGYDVEVSEAGCCGMAGTFGFDEEHYALSMEIARLKLLPWLTPSALKGTSPKSDIESLNQNQNINVVFGGGRVGATGAACRMQIQHAAGVEAQHPIVLVRERLG